MNLLWLVGVCVLTLAYEGERASGSFITADEDTAIGLGGGLDASLDRISSKLQQEKMSRLLSIEDDDLSGLLKAHEDDIPKDVVKAVKASIIEDAPRLKQVAKTSTTTTAETTALKGLKDQLSTMMAQQASLLAKQETVQKELTEIQASINKQESREKDASQRLNIMKNDIISAVSRSIRQNNKQQMVELQAATNRYQPPQELDDVGSKKSVLAALKKTLSDLKSQVLRNHGDQEGASSSNYRFSQRRFGGQQFSPSFPAWQAFPQQYNDGSQKIHRLQKQVMRPQDSWTDAGDPNYVMSVDEDAFAPQGTPLYSDQTLGTFSPDYTN